MTQFLKTSQFLLFLLCPLIFYAQTQTYTGIVIDQEFDEPLIGVSVLIKNTSTGTLTDIDGNYSLKASSGDTLSFIYLGYKTSDLVLSAQPINDIFMITDSKLLDEVVVVGYGTVRKSDLTGSVSSVKSEDITKVPAANPMQALQGKVAGLQILSTSGDPGSDPIVRLRGVTTLNDNNPIAVIDGIITDVSAVALLNSNDIESIEVLKDASATAIYGSRGAAGVIIVTTKRGVAGENRVQFSFERGIESVANKIDVMNGEEFATYINKIEPGTYNNFDLLGNTAWQDLIYNDNSPITNANLSFSGGSENATHYVGFGYFNQKGVLPKSDLERITGKINSTYNVNKDIKVGIDLSVLVSDKNNAPGVISTALRAIPIDLPFQEDGETFADVQGSNPLAAIEYSNSNTKRVQGLANIYASIDFLSGFTFKSSAQFELAENKSRNFTPKYFVGTLQQNEENDLTYNSNTFNSVIGELTLAFNKEFGKSRINSVIGFSAQDRRSEFISGSTEGLIREDPLFWYLDAGQNEFDQVSNLLSRQTLISYLGRINYSFDNRFLITVSGRVDGSSNVGPGNKYGFFPSAALGWNITNESFFPDNSIFNNLKARVSWGIIGNEKIPGTAQYSRFGNGRDAVFGIDENIQPGVAFDGGGNPLLQWEETIQTNVGLNIGMWQDKLTLELDYYIKESDGILVPLSVPGHLGIGAFRTIFFNAANVKNSGFEWNLNYRNRVNDFSYGIGVLGTTINNEVTDLGESQGASDLIVGGDLGNGQQVARSRVGSQIGFLYGYDVEGIFQNQEELDSGFRLPGQGIGDFRYRDVNGDGKISSDDRTMIGNSIPNLVYGFNAQIGYKNLTLSADFQGQAGNDIYNGKQAIRFTTLNYEDKFNNFWDGEGSTNTDPKPSLGGTNFIPSSYFVEDGSFIRLRTVTLNYTVPNNLLQKVYLQNMNIYVRGTNLFTATSFTGYSPEIGAGNATDGVIDNGIYPITRVITVGLNANF